VDQSSNPWRGWGEGRQPPSVQPQQSGHWGRWSLALVPGGSARARHWLDFLMPGAHISWAAIYGGLDRRRTRGPEHEFFLGWYTRHPILKGADSGAGTWVVEVRSPSPIAPESSPSVSCLISRDGPATPCGWMTSSFMKTHHW